MNILEELKLKFRTGDVLTRLVLVNCGMFVLILIADIFYTLFTSGTDMSIARFFQFPWNPAVLLRQPWSIATALFTSHGLWHLLFNMITLFWLGGIFLQFFTSNGLRGLYVLGGVAGMLCFMAVFLVFPSVSGKEWQQTIPLTSACILAFSTALAFRAPNHAEPIPLFGPVKIKYIVIVLALADAALLPKSNPASDFAHLGAAATGWLYIFMLRKGHDITAPVTWLFVKTSNLTRSVK